MLLRRTVYIIKEHSLDGLLNDTFCFSLIPRQIISKHSPLLKIGEKLNLTIVTQPLEVVW